LGSCAEDIQSHPDEAESCGGIYGGTGGSFIDETLGASIEYGNITVATRPTITVAKRRNIRRRPQNDAGQQKTLL
jgi:hypothetical protein